MAYRLKLRKPLEESVRRVLIEQCERVAATLGGADAVAAVHDARKGLKRMRALLRLVRHGLGHDAWRKENVVLRDIARQLAHLRDADVTQLTIARLAADATPALTATLQRLAQSMAKSTAKSAAHDRDARSAVLAAARREIDTCQSRFNGFELAGDDAEVILEGLAATLHRARTVLTEIAAEPSDEAMHELRKCVQIHWRHLALLVPAWPDVMKARIGEARRLAALLGEHNDLALLVGHAGSAGQGGLDARGVGRIAKACRLRQADIRAEGVVRARRLFAGRPRQRAAEIVEAWTAARVLASFEQELATPRATNERHRQGK